MSKGRALFKLFVNLVSKLFGSALVVTRRVKMCQMEKPMCQDGRITLIQRNSSGTVPSPLAHG